jgi:formylglycine-generating enzyme required for sulfatase activity
MLTRGKAVNRCPSREQLQELLAENLSEDARVLIEDHVEVCAACAEVLAGLSDSTDDWQHLRRCRRVPVSDADAAITQYLKDNPPEKMAPAREGSMEAIGFPGPCTEKGPLGRLDCYHVRRVLGYGRFGIVYQAYDALDRLVAIKVLKPELAASVRERARFEHEARKAAAVKHDHIVTIHQVGHASGFPLPYLVMEYVDGEPLSDRLERQGAMEGKEAARIVQQVALALAAAHARGLVHRDIKPSNILLEADAARAKLTDFGLARATEAVGVSTSQSGRIVGTPAYMSPEQIITPDQIDGRSDVYSLGVVLYELLTGERPFRGATHLVLQQVTHDEPRPPRKLNDRIPRDLETICLKAMAKTPAHRYATAREVADDLGRFLAGELIRARPVGSAEKLARWGRRNPAIASLLAVLAVTTALAGWGSYEAYGRLEAHFLRDRLLDANTIEVPTIVKDMAGYRRWINPLLREAYQDAEANQNRGKQLHASLALLPVDANQRDYLFGRFLDAEPQEVLVLRDALSPYKQDLLDKLWTAAEHPAKGQAHRRLRAACALAAYDPDGQHWADVQKRVAEDLVSVPPVYLERWMDALRPAGNKLVASLTDIYRNVNRDPVKRSAATNILAEYAANQPQVLAELLMDADEKQFPVMYSKLENYQDRALTLLHSELDKQLDSKGTVPEEAKEKLAKRQANAAVALFKMGEPEAVWPLLKHSSDPTVRSYLVHRLGPLEADLHVLVKQLQEEPDVTIRRAIILSLGEFAEDRLVPGERDLWAQEIAAIYRAAADPGLHGAAKWLLRQWKLDKWIQQVDERWRNDPRARQQRLERIRQELTKERGPVKPQWYVNSQGQTMVVFPGPAEFWMGSPPTEAGHRVSEALHRERIGRAFALAATHVTVEQFKRFNPQFGHEKMYLSPQPDCPVLMVTWYEAAAYCNWLSQQEGLPPDQWCYVPKNPSKFEEGVVLPPDYLRRTGYRLPSEAEWEYACRAEAVTSRFYGEGDELLSKYAWYFRNSGDRTWPVGSLKPNDWGLFDMHGLLHAWCQERYQSYPLRQGEMPSEDTEDTKPVIDREGRVLRGGSFGVRAVNVRCAERISSGPPTVSDGVGFRPARTFR